MNIVEIVSVGWAFASLVLVVVFLNHERLVRRIGRGSVKSGRFKIKH